MAVQKKKVVPTNANANEPGEIQAPAASAPVAPSVPEGHVQVGKQVVKLGKVKSIATIYDLMGAVNQNELRGLAACLGACWEAGGSAHPPARWATCKTDALAYGGQVIDALTERGVLLPELKEASIQAFLVCAQRLPGAQEVKEAEGN